MDYQAICFCELIKNAIHPDKNYYLKDEVDWSYMVQLAKVHNLLPVLMEEAVKYPEYTERPEYMMEMRMAFSIVATQTKHTKDFLKLYGAFAEKGIYPIVMKGLICRELYGKLCDHRTSGDEDILIHPTEYWRAKEVLIANGYVPEEEEETEAQFESVQEFGFTHPTEKLYIELHLNPMGRGNDTQSRMSDCFKNAFKNYREIKIDGVRIRTMSHQDHLLYLILHAFRHFTGGGVGIRQMLDILLYQEQYGAEIDLKKLYETIKSFRADDFWSDIVHIGNSYFGFELSTVQSAKCPENLLEDMLECGVFGNDTQAKISAAKVTRLAIANHLKNKTSNLIIMIWRTIFPEKAYLLEQASYLDEQPWLLPIAWVRRWGRFIKKSRNNDGNLAAASVRISQKRMNLLKKYDLV